MIFFILTTQNEDTRRKTEKNVIFGKMKLSSAKLEKNVFFQKI